MQRSKLKRYHFSIKGIRKGYLFCQNGTEALYRGDRCREVETRVNVWTVRQKNGRCGEVVVNGGSTVCNAGQGSPHKKIC